MTKKYSKVLSLFLAVAMCFGMLTVFANAATTNFTDVPKDSWFYDAVTQCANQGYVSGVGNNQFMPNGKLTYAQVFTMLTNAFFKTEKQDYEDNRWMQMDEYFGGNPEWWSYNAYYFNDKGFLDGTSVNIKSSASANSPITRYEMVQIVNNILKSKGITVSSADKAAAQLKIADWSSVPVKYHDAVSTCFSLGIVNGYSGNRFVGTDTLTRAQACVILNTLMDVVAQGGSAKPPVTEPEEPELKPIYEYCDCTCDACKDCQGTIVGYEPVEKPSVPVETTKPVEVTTKVTQYGTGYYIADNGFGDGYLNNGKPITEANVLEMLKEAREIWPEGGRFGDPNTYDNQWYEFSGPVVDSILINRYKIDPNYCCGGLASMLSDYVFGLNNNPMRQVSESELRPGDIVITYKGGVFEHVAFVITSDGNGAIQTADGGQSCGVTWNDGPYDTPGKPSDSDRIWDYLHPDRPMTRVFYTRYPA